MKNLVSFVANRVRSRRRPGPARIRDALRADRARRARRGDGSRQPDQHTCCGRSLPLPTSDAIVLAAVVAASGAAATIDLRTGRIPNLLTATVAVTGLALAGLGLSGHSMAGALVGRPDRVRADAAGALARRHRRRRREAARRARHAARTRRHRDGVSLQRDRGRPAGRRTRASSERRLGTTVSRTARLMRAPSETKKEIDGAAQRQPVRVRTGTGRRAPSPRRSW